MKYWIIIDEWNLLESFTTESLSPHIFYLRRAFGNDLTRYISKGGELPNQLILYKKEPFANFAIELDGSLLDKSLLMEYRKGDAYLYPKTIYYKKGKVRFRFKDQHSISAFVAESCIILEIKTVKKYSDDFYVETNTPRLNRCEHGHVPLPLDIDQYIIADNYYNVLKGAIVSYLCGQKTSTSVENQSLILSLTSLKNMVAGLNTVVMVEEEKEIDWSQCRALLHEVSEALSGSPFNDISKTVEVLKHILDEIISLSILRLKIISEQKKPSFKNKVKRLRREKTECEDRLRQLENTIPGLKDCIEQLNNIKDQEAKTGKSKHVKRWSFPKGSPEYNKKKELREQIKTIERNNLEYKNTKNNLKSISKALRELVEGITKYDSTIASLFSRFSDNINSILKSINLRIANKNMRKDLFPQLMHQEDSWVIRIDNVSVEEEALYNTIFGIILSQSNERQNSCSDGKIVELIERVRNKFSENELSKSAVGTCIMDTLRTFWMYKKQLTDSFEIPSDLPLLQAVMSFLIKPGGFADIDRFMLRRGYQLKQYAYMLWGAMVGYAAIPKTMTNLIANSTEEGLMDDYLSYLHNRL